MPLPQTQTSFPLSDSDVVVVTGWGLQIALGFLLLGIQLTLSSLVFFIFVAQGIPLSKARLALSFITIIMFLASLSSLAITIYFIIIQIPLNGYNPPDPGEIFPLMIKLQISLSSLNRLNYIIGDMVVVWRAWVLFPQRLSAKIALSVCLMGSFVGVFWNIGLIAKRVLKDPAATGGAEDVILLAVPLIFTNLTATVLIGFKAWHHFQIIKNNLGSTHGAPSKVLKILLLLIESGLLYLAFLICYLALELVSEANTTTAQGVYLTVMPQLVALYPVLIILAVAHKSNKPESVNDISLSQSMQFASVRASKSESGGESQLATGIDNNAELERNEIRIVPRLS
ncbi:hypothetical protein K435DRAFT_974489 [Dendrothele bispora CBS 962.96]|uniref:Family A G protein-coupled receptor-like protein n=1 Tax=Dendrothele bispora (strain CBS 962.96) TaxID=1314807 RepID=A0A4S8KLG8_DENBC|nr:hypothetical protein K435DRAFT_974489 [Dendrothele bispora CBS 962.96]